jgi:hypothetical protein
MKKYFSYSPNYGFEVHESIDDARLTAEEAISGYEENALEEGEWDDEVESVCYGEVLVEATETIKDGASRYSLSSIDLSKDLKTNEL